jgi:hypothetical protein
MGLILPLFACSCLVAALVVCSYRRLLQLQALSRWAASYAALRAEAVPARDAALAARARVADLNEATIELGSRLEQPGAVPRSCARASLFLGAMLALVQAAQIMRSGVNTSWQSPLISLASGALGALACFFIGQSAERLAQQLRSDWSRLIQRIGEDVPTSSRGTR